MSSKDKLYSYYNSDYGQAVMVDEETFKALTKSDRKIRYFEEDLKQEQKSRDEQGEVYYKPSREDSLDRLTENNIVFADNSIDTEKSAMLNMLKDCLHLLDKQEREIILAIYFDGKSEFNLSAETGIPKTTIHNRKIKTLAKIRRLFKG
ncbi:MAG: sigma-70 family RNA polymerase sigma factor [Oscillospiraceae bacterium]|nr:sigma-70 family RNA polymerase sigma factor [Oscillospiraceae bacterium]